MCLPADETKQAGAGRGNSRKIKKDPKAGKMSNLTSHQSNAYLNKNTLGAFCLGPVLGGPLCGAGGAGVIFPKGRLALGSEAFEMCLTFNSAISLVGIHPKETPGNGWEDFSRKIFALGYGRLRSKIKRWERSSTSDSRAW